MPCLRGCCESQAAHYRSLRLATDRKGQTRTTTDVHDGGMTVDVTEHWHDRQDVLVKNPPTVERKINAEG